jgi:SIR2-like domain
LIQRLDLYKELCEKVKKANYAETSSRGGGEDFELIYASLVHIATSEKISSVSHVTELSARPIGELRKRAARAKIELQLIDEFLQRELWLSQPNDPRLLYLLPLLQGSLGGTIATLNYDNSIEAVTGEGFAGIERSLVRVVIPDKKQVRVPSEAAGSVRLLKLHGSIDWKRSGDSVVYEEVHAGDKYQPAIIVGSGNKLRYFGPYLDLYSAFRESLRRSRFLVAIGYSFRDEHINYSIESWARGDGPAGRHLTLFLGKEDMDLPHAVKAWEPLEVSIHFVRQRDAADAFGYIGEIPIPDPSGIRSFKDLSKNAHAQGFLASRKYLIEESMTSRKGPRTS